MNYKRVRQSAWICQGHFQWLLTIPEAADQLGLSVAMVRRYCATRKLPAQKVGRDWALTQRDVERFAASPHRRGRRPVDLKETPEKALQP